MRDRIRRGPTAPHAHPGRRPALGLGSQRPPGLLRSGSRSGSTLHRKVLPSSANGPILNAPPGRGGPVSNVPFGVRVPVRKTMGGHSPGDVFQDSRGHQGRCSLFPAEPAACRANDLSHDADADGAHARGERTGGATGLSGRPTRYVSASRHTANPPRCFCDPGVEVSEPTVRERLTVRSRERPFGPAHAGLYRTCSEVPGGPATSVSKRPRLRCCCYASVVRTHVLRSSPAGLGGPRPGDLRRRPSDQPECSLRLAPPEHAERLGPLGHRLRCHVGPLACGEPGEPLAGRRRVLVDPPQGS